MLRLKEVTVDLDHCHWGSKQHYNGDVMEIPDVYTSLCLHYSLMHAHAQ